MSYITGNERSNAYWKEKCEHHNGIWTGKCCRRCQFCEDVPACSITEITNPTGAASKLFSTWHNLTDPRGTVQCRFTSRQYRIALQMIAETVHYKTGWPVDCIYKCLNQIQNRPTGYMGTKFITLAHQAACYTNRNSPLAARYVNQAAVVARQLVA